MLGSYLRRKIIIPHHLGVGGARQSSNAMVDLCVFLGLCLNIYVGMKKKLIQYGKGEMMSVCITNIVQKNCRTKINVT
jgi:hypothetical protein